MMLHRFMPILPNVFGILLIRKWGNLWSLDSGIERAYIIRVSFYKEFWHDEWRKDVASGYCLIGVSALTLVIKWLMEYMTYKEPVPLIAEDSVMEQMEEENWEPAHLGLHGA